VLAFGEEKSAGRQRKEEKILKQMLAFGEERSVREDLE